MDCAEGSHRGGGVQRQIVHVLLIGIGYACFLALNSFSLWGFTLLPVQTLGEQASYSWGTALSVSNALSFFGFALFSGLRPLRFAKRVYAFSCLFVGAALACVAGFFATNALVLVVFGGVFAGLATTCFFFCWVSVFAHEGLFCAQVEIIVGSVLSAVPFVSFLTLKQPVISFTILILAGCVLVFLAVAMKGGGLFGAPGSSARLAEPRPLRADAHPQQAEPRPLRAVGHLWRVLLCCFIVGAMAPFVSGFSNEVFNSFNFVDQVFLVHSENIVAAIIVGVSWLALKRRPDTVRMFTFLFPLLSTAFLIFFFVPSLRGLVPYIGGVAFVVCSMTVLMQSVQLKEEHGCNVGLVYGACAGVLYSANAFGSLIVDSIGSALAGEASMTLIVVVLLYGCSIVLYFITRHQPRSSKRGAVDAVSEVGGPEGSVPDDGAEGKASDVDAASAAARAIGAEKGLTERQLEVLALLARGYTVSAIASTLFLSENTVRTHAKRIYSALDVHSKQELIELVVQASKQ